MTVEEMLMAPAGRELDAWLENLFFGFGIRQNEDGEWMVTPTDGEPREPVPFSTNSGAGGRLVGQLNGAPKGQEVVAKVQVGNECHEGRAATYQLALCRAALKAKKSQLGLT